MNYHINITIRLFNLLRDIGRENSITVSLPVGAGRDDILRAIKERHKELSYFIFDETGELKAYIKLFRSASPPPTDEVHMIFLSQCAVYGASIFFAVHKSR